MSLSLAELMVNDAVNEVLNRRKPKKSSIEKARMQLESRADAERAREFAKSPLAVAVQKAKAEDAQRRREEDEANLQRYFDRMESKQASVKRKPEKPKRRKPPRGLMVRPDGLEGPAPVVLIDGERIEREPVPSAVRMRILYEDRVCAWCKVAKAESIDHVIPVSRGGSNDEFNLVGSCSDCNSEKSNYLPKELGWVMRIPPRYFMEGFADRPDSVRRGHLWVRPRKSKGDVKGNPGTRTLDPVVRAAILERDKMCRWCNCSESVIANRVIPRSRGGNANRMNLVGSCAACQEKRGSALPVEIGWRLRFPVQLLQN